MNQLTNEAISEIETILHVIWHSKIGSGSREQCDRK